VRALLLEQQFSRALETIWQVIGEGDRYITEQAPWTLKKTDPARMVTVLYVLAETVRNLAIVVQPFMPHAMERMLDQLAVPAEARSFKALGKPARSKSAPPCPRLPACSQRYEEEAA
jgi:methionyl-tRNA synthetase